MTLAPMITITDWRVRNEDDLPDVLPGMECERVITPQKPCVLHRIVVRRLHLIHACLGTIRAVPFELASADGRLWFYRLNFEQFGVSVAAQLAALVAAGTTPMPSGKIWIPAGMDVRILLRNNDTAPAKPYAALLVQEENT